MGMGMMDPRKASNISTPPPVPRVEAPRVEAPPILDGEVVVEFDTGTTKTTPHSQLRALSLGCPVLRSLTRRPLYETKSISQGRNGWYLQPVLTMRFQTGCDFRCRPNQTQ